MKTILTLLALVVSAQVFASAKLHKHSKSAIKADTDMLGEMKSSKVEEKDNSTDLLNDQVTNIMKAENQEEAHLEDAY
ncbi:hypothetical protein [Peredibacter starrii]|uniref:Pentapeptide MXKDX repeat protein n=1 Tax=Peredibacter starrii TaxID=28202 RepID=A0AAX4HPM4_9BACT|nr:hypothetical protein [Peredibacter starrii]WPU65147.1 hypothetical protein SOO65_00090 [Peredibacter starrii]